MRRRRKRIEERLQRESAEIIRKAHVDAQAIVGKGRTDAERLGEELRQKAREESDGIVKNAERQIQLETRRAVQEIRREAVDLR